MSTENRVSLRRRIGDFCRVRVSTIYPPRDAEALQTYLLTLITEARQPPKRGASFDWPAIALELGIECERVVANAAILRPAFVAVSNSIPKQRAAAKRQVQKALGPQATGTMSDEAADVLRPIRRRPGRRPAPIVEFPEPDEAPWVDPDSFSEALSLHMRRHGEGVHRLYNAVVRPGETLNKSTILSWRRGAKAPRGTESLALLSRIERRYRLPAGYFKAKLPHPARSATGHSMPGIGSAERRRIAWHLPDDFDSRPRNEQEVILEWVRRVVVSGSTEYRRYQASAMKQRFALRFPATAQHRSPLRSASPDDEGEPDATPEDPDSRGAKILAPPALAREMAELVRFKTSTLTALGFQRNGVWGEETASQKIEHLGLLFGALAASPDGAVRGRGVGRDRLSFAMLIFPSVWDWYLQWRERRRGFYTAWEVDMLQVGGALTRKDTDWLWQRPDLAQRLRAIPGLVSQAEIDAARLDWRAACEGFHIHALARAKELQRVARVHRDPFEPILVVLEADSPVGEYRKITEEIIRLMPDERRYPRAAAEAVRSFLLLRLGLHLGLRQKNLRQLLLCPRGQAPTSERRLADLKRGELRWSDRDNGWEVLIPSIAFKNSDSSFFGNKPYRLVLPDLGDLYRHLEAYIDRHRERLLAGAADPGTFFVKTVKASSATAAYDQNTFYEAWRLTIQRYGIFNPYTGRGAIEGLLPHGPHNIRDVLATHILKKTGSYEQASYAIQDTPDMVAKHYGRFLPQDKAALAAKVLNKVWEAA